MVPLQSLLSRELTANQPTGTSGRPVATSRVDWLQSAVSSTRQAALGSLRRYWRAELPVADRLAAQSLKTSPEPFDCCPSGCLDPLDRTSKS